MTRPTALVAALAAALLVAACGGPDGDPSRPTTTAAPSTAPGPTAPEPDDLDALAASVNDFGFELHRRLAAEEAGNVVTAPLSVTTLLAMVAAGAGGATAEQMVEVLGLDGARDPRVAALLEEVTDTDDVTLTIADSLWLDEDAPLEEDYAEHVIEAFDATLSELPLEDPSSAEQIDTWVREHTEGLIDGIAEDLGLPDPAALLVLVDAVYFLGEWTRAFDPELTRPGEFELADGEVVEVPMMHRPLDPEVQLQMAGRDGYQLLRLPYGDEERYSMELYLPSADSDLDALAGVLDADERRDALAALEAVEGEVLLPRFELEWSGDLVGALVDMGMDLPFSPGADFSAMSAANPALDTVAHSTYLRVDEQGTEAAAVTGGMMTTSLPPGFRADRPFMFVLSDAATGVALFVGTVEDPRG